MKNTGILTQLSCDTHAVELCKSGVRQEEEMGMEHCEESSSVTPGSYTTLRGSAVGKAALFCALLSTPSFRSCNLEVCQADLYRVLLAILLYCFNVQNS